MVVTNAVGPLLGDLTCGTLLQKLQVNLSTISFFFTEEILDEVGESDEQECLVYKSKVQQAAKSRVLHKVLEFVSTVHDLCEDEVNSEDEYEENTDQWTWGYFVVGVMSMGKFMLLVFVELDTFGWK
ncbi:hypothetical protein HID58_010871 [Brassica napus]|uniref:Uncharacterized protein n=1 Tax=Brassica napus TaxID=3708 RepID=A0ABQ8DWN2_BRANA|nr:hypothetical protein HID58_010871 [Brassica napus]